MFPPRMSGLSRTYRLAYVLLSAIVALASTGPLVEHFCTEQRSAAASTGMERCPDHAERPDAAQDADRVDGCCYLSPAAQVVPEATPELKRVGKAVILALQPLLLEQALAPPHDIPPDEGIPPPHVRLHLANAVLLI